MNLRTNVMRIFDGGTMIIFYSHVCAQARVVSGCGYFWEILLAIWQILAYTTSQEHTSYEMYLSDMWSYF